MLGPSHHMKGPEEWQWIDPLVEAKFWTSHLYHMKVFFAECERELHILIKGTDVAQFFPI